MLRKRATERLEDEGVDADTAEMLVDHMLTADLWGRHSHGLSVRLHTMLKQARVVDETNQMEIAQDAGHWVLVDGNNGFGYVAGRKCTRLLIERTRDNGFACIALRNTRHTGMIGYYMDMAAQDGVVAMGFANCNALMAPWGGKERLLGTNPIAFGLPAEPDPIIVDMATSAIAFGEVIERDRRNEALPEGCALDPSGQPTRDPGQARTGAVLPFGQHRGGALAVAVQLLSGALTGSAPIPRGGKDYGLLLIGLQRGLFAGNEEYDTAVKRFIAAYLDVPERPGMEVRLPGSRRYENRRDAEHRGTVEVSQDLADQLCGPG
jgi:L-2-hydroxycarboxylate dehydrogenase (NAD+)